VDNRPGTNHEPIPEFPSNGRRSAWCPEPSSGASAGPRNRGIAETTGEFIAFPLMTMSLLSVNWLRALGVRFALDEDVGRHTVDGSPDESRHRDRVVVRGVFYGGFTKSFLAKKWSMKMRGRLRPVIPYSAEHFGAGCNMAVRRSAFQEYGRL